MRGVRRMDRAQFSELKVVISQIYERFPIIAILLFGSQASDDNNSESDIDVCIVLRPQGDIWDNVNENQNYREILKDIWSIVGDRYDIWLFQELPLHMKFSVIENHKIIICDDQPLLYEYFYQYRSKMRNYEKRLRIAYGWWSDESLTHDILILYVYLDPSLLKLG